MLQDNETEVYQYKDVPSTPEESRDLDLAIARDSSMTIPKIRGLNAASKSVIKDQNGTLKPSSFEEEGNIN